MQEIIKRLVGLTYKHHLSRIYSSEIVRALLILIISILIVFYKVVFLDYTISPASTGIAGISVNRTTEGYPNPPSHPSTFFIDPNIGYQTEANGHLAQKELFSGRPPIWNPYVGSGQPLLANFQSHAALPILYAFDFSNPTHFSYYFILSVFFAGIFTYLFLRELKLSFLPSIVGAFIYMYSGMFFWLYFPYAFAIAFAPGLFWISRRLIDKNSLTNHCLLSVLTFLSLVSGFPEISFLSIVSSFIFFLYFSFGKDLKVFAIKTIKYLIFSALGFGLASYLLLPFLEYLGTTTERNKGLGSHFLGTYQMIAQIMPYFFARWLIPAFKDPYWANTGGYIGSAPFLFLVVSVFVATKKDLKFLLFFIFGIFLILGKSFGFPSFYLLGKLPIFKLLAFYRYSNFLLALSFAALTAFSLTKLENLNKKHLLSIGLLFLLLIAFFGYFAKEEIDLSLVTIDNARRFALSVGGSLFILGSMLLAVLFAINYLSARKAVLLIFLMVFLELFIYVQIDFLRLPKKNDFTKQPEYISFLKRENAENFRVFSMNGMLMPNYSGAFGIQSIQDNDALMIGNYSNYVLKNLDPYTAAASIFTGTDQSSALAPTPADMLRANLPYYSFLGVKYIISKEAVNHDSLLLIKKFEDLNVYQNKDTYPRVFQTQNVKKVDSKDPDKERKINEAILSYSAVVEKGKGFKDTNECQNNSKILEYVSNKVTVENSTSCDSFLILTDNYYPGWKANVNGENKEIYLTNGLVRGVFVKEGKNRIVFTYFPDSFKRGIFISLASATFLFALLVFERKFHLSVFGLANKFGKKARSKASKRNKLVS